MPIVSDSPSIPNVPKSAGCLELRCPPFPQTLLEAVEMLEHPEDIEVRSVTRMVEHDPMLVAQLLKTVNSAYYGLQRTITSPERAVVLLGPVTVVGLVAGMGVVRLRPLVTDETAETADRIIAHSLATAYLTRHLIEEMPEHTARTAYPSLARNGVAFTAGLLHDLGKFILLYNHPEEAMALYRDQALDDLVEAQDACEYERLLFACDHTEAGVMAAHHFHFPKALTDVIRLHHAPEALRGEGGIEPSTACLMRATVAASHVATLAGYGTSARPDRKPYLSDSIWNELIRRDVPEMGTVEALLGHLHTEADKLDQYVGALTANGPGVAERLRQQMRRIR